MKWRCRSCFYYDDVYQEMCQSILEMQKKQEAIS